MKAMFLMRYSYFGISDWRSNASKDASKLLSDARLEKRFSLFEKLPLAALRDQTDPDFDLIVLGSEAMADKHKKRLTEAAKDVLGIARATSCSSHSLRPRRTEQQASKQASTGLQRVTGEVRPAWPHALPRSERPRNCVSPGPMGT